ncbi:ArnT family glycosyltransferase [Calothrix sp. UHCC 0171]|uniref:ArnT family glycosyltransferase n=1 Tax=Calothrix sp. UHCC 0171 TaxID=3110245 RepID=UPI002B1F691E|nr:glycosyltransferase family 39 protein [Calothrix sp. UHCC 0171]MEA5570103.1 glycosyltransferase family 39 protein [Calothrix sp. UHCC 0171]
MLYIKQSLNNLCLQIQRFLAFPYISLSIWILPLLLFGAGNNSLMAHDEGLYAVRARLMFDSGDWIHPWSSPHHKTPGFYWLIALSYKLFNISEFSVRFPNMILGILSIFLVYEIGKIILNQKLAWLASAILIINFLWLQYCRLGTPDVPMIFLVLLAIFSLLKADLSANHKYSSLYCLIGGFCLGLGLLFRSMMIFLPIIALLPYLIWGNRGDRLINKPSLYLGFFIGLIPTLIWLWLSVIHYGNASIIQLLEFVFRLGSKQRGKNGIFFYLLSLPITSFPWFFLALIGLFTTIYQPLNQLQSRYKLILVGFPVILFVELSLFSTRLPHYSLCLFPFLSLLVAVGLDTLSQIYTYIITKRRKLVLVPENLEYLHKLPQYLSYIFGIFGIIFLIVGIVTFYFGSSKIHQYSIVAIVVGFGWLFLPTIWIGSYYFHLKFLTANFWVASWLIPVWLGLAVAGGNGLLSDYNPDFRKFIQQPEISQILNSYPINFVNVGGKSGVLIDFYTQNIGTEVSSLTQLTPSSYAWIEEKQVLESSVPHQIIGTVQEYSLVQVLK